MKIEFSTDLAGSRVIKHVRCFQSLEESQNHDFHKNLRFSLKEGPNITTILFKNLNYVVKNLVLNDSSIC